MIYSFDLNHRTIFGGYLREMHKQRYDIYVATRGWIELDSFFDLEIDEYDSPLATYLLSIEGQRVLGGIRVMPTSIGTFLGEHYKEHLFDKNYAFGEGVWEMYRLFVSDPEWRSDGGHPVRRELMLSLYEFLLKQGAKKLVAVSDASLVEKLPPFWSFREIGERSTFKQRGAGDGECALVEIDITQEIYDTTCKMLGYQKSALSAPENSLEEWPEQIRPEEIYAVNKWLHFNPENIRTSRDFLQAAAEGDKKAAAAFKQLVRKAVGFLMTNPNPTPTQQAKLH